jgi:hypothetical protein
MPNTYVTVEDVAAELGRPLTDLETRRVQIEIDSTFTTLEKWCNRKFEQTVITDERHVMRGYNTTVTPRWAPVLSFQGIKYGDITQPLMTQWNNYWENLSYAPNAIVFISYTTDDSLPREYAPVIKDIICDEAIKTILTPDIVNYGVVSGYTVEGMGITYNEGQSAGRSKRSQQYMSQAVTHLQELLPLRRRIVV